MWASAAPLVNAHALVPRVGAPGTVMSLPGTSFLPSAVNVFENIFLVVHLILFNLNNND